MFHKSCAFLRIRGFFGAPGVNLSFSLYNETSTPTRCFFLPRFANFFYRQLSIKKSIGKQAANIIHVCLVSDSIAPTKFSLGKNHASEETREMKGGAPCIHSLIYWPHVISREIDLCEIAPSRVKRAPRVRSAQIVPKRSKGEVTKSEELSSGKKRAIKRKILLDFYRRFHSLTQRAAIFVQSSLMQFLHFSPFLRTEFPPFVFARLPGKK